MFEIILSSALTCQEGNILIDKIWSDKDVAPVIRRELVREVNLATPVNCNQRK
jgi:hypothetical protein